MNKKRNLLIALAWCWVSAVVSMLVMADKGSLSADTLPMSVFMATVGVVLGPLFFAAGLFGRGGSPMLGIPFAVISYAAYVMLLYKAVCSRNPHIRYACLSMITLGSFIAWQGLRNSI